MKHIHLLNKWDLNQLEVGEEFTYPVPTIGKIMFRKGQKVSENHMVPIGLYCESINSARRQR